MLVSATTLGTLAAGSYELFPFVAVFLNKIFGVAFLEAKFPDFRRAVRAEVLPISVPHVATQGFPDKLAFGAIFLFCQPLRFFEHRRGQGYRKNFGCSH